jgi:Protein of unknown function (DUF3592)
MTSSLRAGDFQAKSVPGKTGTIRRASELDTRPLLFVVFFGFWSIITLLFDYGACTAIGHQLLALGFKEAPGVIASSRVKVDSDSEGTSYTPVIDYRYTAGGNQLTGNTIRHGSFHVRPGEAYRLVEQFSAGSPVTVYYNPRQPSDSLLLPGLTSGHVFMVLFLTPFNLVMVGGWVAAWDWLHARCRGSLPRCAKLTSTYDGFSLKIYSMTPLTAALIGFFGVSAAAIFAVGVLSLFIPPVVPVIVACLCTAIVPVWIFRRQLKFAKVLEVNELRGTFEVRDGSGRRPKWSGSLSQLSGIAVRERVKRDSEGSPSKSYVLLLSRKTAKGPRRLCLLSGMPDFVTRQLAQWLAERLRIADQCDFA